MEFRRVFEAGQPIFNEGDVGDCAYVVETGSVDITTTRDDVTICLATREAGQLFGEMAIIDDKPRSAAAIAKTDVRLWMITRDQLNQRIERIDPMLRMCINVILDHLRDTLRRLTHGAEVPRPIDEGEADNVTDLPHDALHTIKLEQELHTAVERRQFELHYQPLIDLETGLIAGFEALMRWQHPERGMVSPIHFIPVAEQSGLIVPMTRWAFRHALETLARFQIAMPGGDERRPLFMSVNFSGQEFSRTDFIEQIDAAIRETSVDPACVKIEVTESHLMHSPDTARDLLQKCRDRGAGVAIDDFGTGYSSLSYLHSLPADTLKVDQSFVRSMLDDASNMSLVRSIVGLAKGLDMKIVAEGVEEVRHAARLHSLGCDYGQGYLYSRPLPEDDVVELLGRWTPQIHSEDV